MSELKYQTERVPALDGLRGYAALIATFCQAVPQLEAAGRVLLPRIGEMERRWRSLEAIVVWLRAGEAACRPG